MTMLSEGDPHVVLGVDADADLATIKKAYRRLAMRLHPDRNPDPAAQDAFKRLQAAYTELVDARGTAQEAVRPAARGEDRWQDLELDLEDAFAGCEKTVSVLSEAACERCEGSGRVELAHSRLCQCCNGSGRVRAGKGLEACGVCEGRGYTRRANCPDCAGLGTVRRAREFAVKVPPGMLDGDELRLEGRGIAADVPGAAAGDLRLRIRLRAHPLYRLVGRDLHLDRPLSAFLLLGGGELVVPSLGGLRSLRLSPAPCVPTELRVEGAGYCGRGAQAPGALVVRLLPVFPTTADARLLPLYHRLQEELDAHAASALPEVHDWEGNWLAGR